MSEPFDPYYTWLGIPPAEQPPNHYRLLGLQVFETNPQVIDNAADRQMLHLRTFQNGPNFSDSQRLLNEVSAAKLCLLNKSRKAIYDDQMRQQKPSLPLPTNTALGSHSPFPKSVPPTRSGTARGGKDSQRTLAILKVFIGGIVGIAAAVMVVQYATGIDLLGWSAKHRRDGGTITKAAADLRPAQDSRDVKTSSRPTDPRILPTPVVPPLQKSTEVKAPPILIKPPILPAPVAPSSSQTKVTPPAVRPPSVVYEFGGPELPDKVAIKIMRNIIHTNGDVTLGQMTVPVDGAWSMANHELLLTSFDKNGSTNSAVEIPRSADKIQEIRVKARTIAPTKSSVRITCGNVYAILNWEVKNENHILIDGHHVAVCSPHCLTVDESHDIVLRQDSDLVRVAVDGKEVFFAKGAVLTGSVQIASSHKGVIGVKSVEVVSERKPDSEEPKEGR